MRSGRGNRLRRTAGPVAASSAAGGGGGGGCTAGGEAGKNAGARGSGGAIGCSGMGMPTCAGAGATGIAGAPGAAGTAWTSGANWVAAATAAEPDRELSPMAARGSGRTMRSGFARRRSASRHRTDRTQAVGPIDQSWSTSTGVLMTPSPRRVGDLARASRRLIGDTECEPSDSLSAPGSGRS